MRKFINEASWDRIARVVLGIVMLVVGLGVISGGWGIVVAVVGLVPFVTGLVGWCPLYAIFGVRTAHEDASIESTV